MKQRRTCVDGIRVHELTTFTFPNSGNPLKVQTAPGDYLYIGPRRNTPYEQFESIDYIFVRERVEILAGFLIEWPTTLDALFYALVGDALTTDAKYQLPFDETIFIRIEANRKWWRRLPEKLRQSVRQNSASVAN